MALGVDRRSLPPPVPEWLKKNQPERQPPVVLDLQNERPRGNPEEAAKKAAQESWNEVRRTRNLLETMSDAGIRANLSKELAGFEERIDHTRDDLLPPEALADKQRRKQEKEAARFAKAAPEGTPPIALKPESDDAFLARLQAEAATRKKEISETEAFIAEFKAKQAAREKGQTTETPQEAAPSAPANTAPEAPSDVPLTPETVPESKEVRADRVLGEIKETWQNIQEMLRTIQEMRRSGAPQTERMNALQIRHDLDARLEGEIVTWAKVMQEGTERLSGEVLLQMIAEALNTDEERLPVLASDLNHP